MTKRPHLKPELLKEIQSKGNWVKKVDLYHIADKFEYSHESCGRILRIMAKENLIDVEYYKGRWARKLAMYKMVGVIVQPKKLTETINEQGQPVMKYV